MLSVVEALAFTTLLAYSIRFLILQLGFRQENVPRLYGISPSVLLAAAWGLLFMVVANVSAALKFRFIFSTLLLPIKIIQTVITVFSILTNPITIIGFACLILVVAGFFIYKFFS